MESPTEQRTPKRHRDETLMNRSCESTPLPLPPSPDIDLATTVPRSLLRVMQKVGAHARYIDGIDLITCVAHDPAYCLFKKWATSNEIAEVDPCVEAFLENLPLSQCALQPSRAVAHQIVDEANSIIDQYKSLRVQNFPAGHPELLHGQLSAAIPSRYHHASIATHAVVERVCNPALGRFPAAEFQSITTQPSGTYLCTLRQTWKSRIIHIRLMKS